MSASVRNVPSRFGSANAFSGVPASHRIASHRVWFPCCSFSCLAPRGQGFRRSPSDGTYSGLGSKLLLLFPSPPSRCEKSYPFADLVEAFTWPVLCKSGRGRTGDVWRFVATSDTSRPSLSLLNHLVLMTLARGDTATQTKSNEKVVSLGTRRNGWHHVPGSSFNGLQNESDGLSLCPLPCHDPGSEPDATERVRRLLRNIKTDSEPISWFCPLYRAKPFRAE